VHEQRGAEVARRLEHREDAGVVEVRPAECVPICAPGTELPHAALQLARAASESCIGIVPSPTNRDGRSDRRGDVVVQEAREVERVRGFAQ